MRIAVRISALMLALLFAAAGWRASPEQLTLQPQSRLWIEGTSTIRSFTCSAGEVNAIVYTGSTKAVARLLAGEKAVIAVDVKVPAEKMNCGNGTMNEHMVEALKSNEQPTILFRLASYEVTRNADAVTGTLKGTLSLGGVQKPLTLTVDGKADGEMLRVTGTTDVRMTDYGLEPPSLMFGRIKVGDRVTVRFDLLLKS